MYGGQDNLSFLSALFYVLVFYSMFIDKNAIICVETKMSVCNKLTVYHRLLDLSFNRIKKIENLNHLHKLKKLFLVNNKITEIEDISQLIELTMLELGANRIRVSLSVVSCDIIFVLVICLIANE